MEGFETISSSINASHHIHPYAGTFEPGKENRKAIQRLAREKRRRDLHVCTGMFGTEKIPVNRLEYVHLASVRDARAKDGGWRISPSVCKKRSAEGKENMTENEPGVFTHSLSVLVRLPSCICSNVDTERTEICCPNILVG